MISKYISLKQIVEKLYRDFESNESYDIDDLAEWAGEALRKINVNQQYLYQAAELSIENHKAYLPCNYHHVEQVYYEGFPLKYNLSTYPPTQGLLNNTNKVLYEKPVSQGISGADLIISDLTALGYEVSKELENLLKGTFSMLKTSIVPDGYYYEIYDNHIYTSFEEGTVLMLYRGIPVDLEGYPLIPDNVYYEEAIASYLQYKIDYKDWRSSRISDKVYTESKSNWLKFVRAARAAGTMPNLDKLESIKKMWVRLIPNNTANKGFYTNLSNEEIFKIR